MKYLSESVINVFHLAAVISFALSPMNLADAASSWGRDLTPSEKSQLIGEVAICRSDSNRRYGAPIDKNTWSFMKNINSAIRSRWDTAVIKNREIEKLRKRGQCPAFVAPPPEPNAKYCNPRIAAREKTACYALVWGKDECVRAIKRYNPKLARTFSDRTALGLACDLSVKSVLAKRYLTRDAIQTILDESLNTGCDAVKSDNVFFQIFGIATCTSNLFSRTAKRDAANWCAKKAGHFCDKPYLSWLDKAMPTWHLQNQKHAKCNKLQQTVSWASRVGTCECNVYKNWQKRLGVASGYWKRRASMCAQMNTCAKKGICKQLFDPNW